MLIVSARQLGNPIVMLVEMKAGDGLIHNFCGESSQSCHDKRDYRAPLKIQSSKQDEARAKNVTAAYVDR